MKMITISVSEDAWEEFKVARILFSMHPEEGAGPFKDAARFLVEEAEVTK